jgi:hypothetical protein
MEINKEEWDHWKQANPVTLEVLKVLRERKDKISAQLGEGACLGNDCEHGKAVGRCLEIKDLLEMEFEDLKVTE